MPPKSIPPPADDEPALPTPMVRHYLRVKAEHPDDILLYRIGDFYETFGADAEETSRLLGIALTKKHTGSGRTMPLAGIPYHALDSYLGRLIAAGRRVAICEQIEDAKDVKGRPVERAVTRVVTPGTVIEEGLLPEKAHNHLAAVALHKGRWGLACCDLSTGSLAATQFGGDDPRAQILDELARLRPSEMIGAEEDLAALVERLDPAEGARITMTRVDAGSTRHERAHATLLEQFRVQNLQGFGAGDSPAAACAAGALVAYLRQTQRRALGHIASLEIYSASDYMILDAVTQRSLELVRNLSDGGSRGTLLETLDRTRTPMGARLLRDWLLQPLQDLEAIAARQDAVESLFENTAFRDALRDSLGGVRDLERILARVHCRAANARDLLAMARSLRETPSVKSALMRHGRGMLAELGRAMATMTEVADAIESALVPDPPVSTREGGMIRDGHDAELDGIREVARGGRTWIGELRAREIERSGIASLKIGFNRVFGYYIETSKANAAKVPADWERRQTLAGAERYVTPELKEKEALILGADERIHALELELFERLLAAIEAQGEGVRRLSGDLARVDALVSLAVAAVEGGWTRPVVDGSDALDVRGGRHPVVESLMSDRPFVPNDLRLDEEARIWVITGPNMAGKSTFIRQAAILSLMAHVGSFVPAKSARVGLVDRVFTRIGATDHLTRGQSTFLVEMTETANILNNATPRSLVILDEIGRGTSTYDGLSIAWAVLEHLHEKRRRRARTLFATHYHELAELEGRLARVRNYNVAVQERGEEITFLYRIVPGASDHSYGIHAARLAGIPSEVVDRARAILFELECSRRSEAGEGGGGGNLADGAPQPEGHALPASPLASSMQSIPSIQSIQSIQSMTDTPPHQPATTTATPDPTPPAAPPARREDRSPARRRDPARAAQMDLFASDDSPILEALRRIDATRLTPIQALALLDELSRAAREGR